MVGRVLKENKPTFLDYSCGKGNIILIIFYKYYNSLQENYNDKKLLCQFICEKIYFADINPLNVFITLNKLKKICKFICNEDNFTYNYYIGNSFQLDLMNIWNNLKYY